MEEAGGVKAENSGQTSIVSVPIRTRAICLVTLDASLSPGKRAKAQDLPGNVRVPFLSCGKR